MLDLHGLISILGNYNTNKLKYFAQYLRRFSFCLPIIRGKKYSNLPLVEDYSTRTAAKKFQIEGFECPTTPANFLKSSSFSSQPLNHIHVVWK